MNKMEIFKYLRWILAAISLAMFLLCFALVPYIAFFPERFFPGISLPLWWLLPAFYLLQIPLLIGLLQAFAACKQILREQQFSEDTALRLLRISRCALVEMLLLILLGILLLITKLLFPWLFLFFVLLLFAASTIALSAAVFAGMIRQKQQEGATASLQSQSPVA